MKEGHGRTLACLPCTLKKEASNLSKPGSLPVRGGNPAKPTGHLWSSAVTCRQYMYGLLQSCCHSCFAAPVIHTCMQGRRILKAPLQLTMSTPSTRFCQNAAGPSDRGKRQLKPMTAAMVGRRHSCLQCLCHTIIITGLVNTHAAQCVECTSCHLPWRGCTVPSPRAGRVHTLGGNANV